jgi:ABC-type transport system involved in multi-copper enzyme maturation permease subunit
MDNFLTVIRYTILDQIRQKSFLVLLGIGVLLVLLLRSCYGGSYSVNGQQIDGVTLAWHASKIAFHVIVTAMYLMAALMAMSVFRRDRDDGSMILFLSRPIRRWVYAVGRIVGVWSLASVFMFILHGTAFCIMWVKTGGMIPGYLLASGVCFVNVLFIVALIALCSLYIPDIMAALAGLAVVVVGFVSDGGYQLMNSPMVKSAVPPEMVGHTALWRLFYPKLFMVQSYAESLFTGDAFNGMGPVHPLLNVLFFTALLLALLVIGFNRKEI